MQHTCIGRPVVTSLDAAQQYQQHGCIGITAKQMQAKAIAETLKRVTEGCISLFDRACSLMQLPYDVMDVNMKAFEVDFAAFRAIIKELERRLGALIMQVGPVHHCPCAIVVELEELLELP
jgi:hypothetical protein